VGTTSILATGYSSPKPRTESLRFLVGTGHNLGSLIPLDTIEFGQERILWSELNIMQLLVYRLLQCEPVICSDLPFRVRSVDNDNLELRR